MTEPIRYILFKIVLLMMLKTYLYAGKYELLGLTLLYEDFRRNSIDLKSTHPVRSL